MVIPRTVRSRGNKLAQLRRVHWRPTQRAGGVCIQLMLARSAARLRAGKGRLAPKRAARGGPSEIVALV